MDLSGVAMAGGVLGATGLAVGILLGVAGKVFSVKVDETETKIRELLPGSNCGGCGYAGCDALAKAIALREASVSTCPVAGMDKRIEISNLLGVEPEGIEHEIAVVKCLGTCEKTKIKYNYYGTADCRKLASVPGGGQKSCSYGCLGFASCVRVCKFDAIRIEGGVAVVDPEKCTACGTCMEVCPRDLIEKIPYSAKYKVLCNSTEKAKQVKAVCEVGCIGCGICAKQCKYDAIAIKSNLAYISQDKCKNCGICASKCPTKIISLGNNQIH